MVTLCPLSNLVAVVKVTVTAFPVSVGTLSAAAIVLETEDTAPPSETVGPVAGRSDVLCTVTPMDDAGMGPPMVAPVRVSVMAPAGTSAVVATMYAGAVPEVVVAKLAPVAPMVPLM